MRSARARFCIRSSQDAAPGGSRIVFPADPATFTSQAPIGELYRIPSYVTVDAHLGYEAPNGKWKVWLWGKNIFDKYYITAVIPVDGSVGRFAGMPATYGITFSAEM